MKIYSFILKYLSFKCSTAADIHWTAIDRLVKYLKKKKDITIYPAMFQELLLGMDWLGDIFHKNCYLHFSYILSLFMSFSIALHCQGFSINRNFPCRLPRRSPRGCAWHHRLSSETPPPSLRRSDLRCWVFWYNHYWKHSGRDLLAGKSL